MTHRNYRYYDFIVAAFVTVLLCSNLIGAGKAAEVDLPLVGHVVFGAGILFFPISYFFGDILTEVYGYAHDRRAVWCGFGALLFAAIMSSVVIALTPAPGAYNTALQSGLEVVFGNTWRIIAGSMLAFWAGSFVNSYVLAKLKYGLKGAIYGCVPLGLPPLVSWLTRVCFMSLLFMAFGLPSKSYR